MHFCSPRPMLLFLFSLILTSGFNVQAQEQKQQDGNSSVHVLEIIPAAKVPEFSGNDASAKSLSSPSSMAPESEIAPSRSPVATLAAGFNRQEYQRVYRSIPYSRVQFRANPNYRHDSAMEILTGHPRTKTTVHHEDRSPIKTIPAPSRPSRLLPPLSARGGWFGLLPWLNAW